MDISQETREELLRMAYKNGYNYFKYVWLDELEDQQHLTMLINETRGNNSLSQTYRHIEDHFGFDRDKNGWDSFGIYGIIEDANICYEAGARDSIEDNECNPDNIDYMWNY